MKNIYSLLLLAALFCCSFSLSSLKKNKKENTETSVKAIDYFIPVNKQCVQYKLETSSQNIFNLFQNDPTHSRLIITDSTFHPEMESSLGISKWYYSYTDTEIQLNRIHYNPGKGGMGLEKNLELSPTRIVFKLPAASETLSWYALEDKDTIKYTASWKTMIVNNVSQQVVKITEWKSYLPGATGIYYYAKGIGQYKKVAKDTYGNELFPTTIKAYCK